MLVFSLFIFFFMLLSKARNLDELLTPFAGRRAD